MIKDLFSFK